MLNILTVKETIENIMDELNRATTRLKEIGDIQTDTITPDEELISDMEMSIERMQDIYQDASDVVGLALIMACYGGSKADELFGLNIEFDSSEMRENYLKWAYEILPKCQADKWEDYYDTAWTKAETELNKLYGGNK